ncbi:hypothetical protein Cni_G08309 [Canna indica]|uniref:Uncharacterized protein n=1 Tax=Canna indica TaxID=4628 RepID=A0AAQ3K0H3_9LILI|nr:hypothetical protein Cni_G08309 [Canna indica]
MGRKSGRFNQALKAPFRMLSRARDLYVRSMTSCAGRIEHLGPQLAYPTLPRSFSTHSAGATSADEDLRELIRVASLKRSRSLGLATATPPPPSPLRAPAAVPRSQSVAVGRIDEDKPCDFGDVKPGEDLLLPRSRTYAPGAKRNARGMCNQVFDKKPPY